MIDTDTLGYARLLVETARLAYQIFKDIKKSKKNTREKSSDDTEK